MQGLCQVRGPKPCTKRLQYWMPRTAQATRYAEQHTPHMVGFGSTGLGSPERVSVEAALCPDGSSPFALRLLVGLLSKIACQRLSSEGVAVMPDAP